MREEIKMIIKISQKLKNALGKNRSTEPRNPQFSRLKNSPQNVVWVVVSNTVCASSNLAQVHPVHCVH